MKYTELIKELEAMGYSFSRQTGSHRIFSHSNAIRPISICFNAKNKTFGKIANKLLKTAKLNIQKEG